MVRKCCPACCGIGSYLAREWVRDDSSVSIFKIRSVRRDCEICDGTGRVREPEKLHTHFCNTRIVRRPVRKAANSARLERALGYLISLALVGYAAYLLKKGSHGIAEWSKISIAIMASIVLLFILDHFSATTQFTRWFTLVIFLVVVFGGVALELVPH